MRKMKDHQTKNDMIIILALFTKDVNFAYWPSLLSPNAYLKDCVCKFVVLFSWDPVLVIAIEIVRYYTKMSTKKRNIRKC